MTICKLFIAELFLALEPCSMLSLLAPSKDQAQFQSGQSQKISALYHRNRISKESDSFSNAAELMQKTTLERRVMS